VKNFVSHPRARAAHVSPLSVKRFEIHSARDLCTGSLLLKKTPTTPRRLDTHGTTVAYSLVFDSITHGFRKGGTLAWTDQDVDWPIGGGLLAKILHPENGSSPLAPLAVSHPPPPL
jgi:hypothetical protein